jgi:hypothetical protein
MTARVVRSVPRFAHHAILGGRVNLGDAVVALQIFNPAVSDDSGHRFAGHSAAAAMSSIPLNFPRQRGQGFVMATCNSVTEQLKE